MRPIILAAIHALLLMIGGGQDCHGQTDSNAVHGNEQIIFEPVETYPEFPGSEREIYCFIDRTIDKELLGSVDTTGVAMILFTIDTTGQVTNLRVLRSLTETVDNELMRVIALMPKWTPGMQRGKVVEVQYNLPLKIPYENKHCR